MTHQSLNNLICLHLRVDLSNLKINSDYLSPELQWALSKWTKCPKDCEFSNPARGYVATFRLNADGTFELACIEYPYIEGTRQNFNLVYRGDFFVEFAEFFDEDFPSKTIPFEDGVIVEDQSRWKCYEPLPPFRPNTIVEFRSATISRVKLGFWATKICEDLDINTIGDLEDMRLQFESHRINTIIKKMGLSTSDLYSIEYRSAKAHLRRCSPKDQDSI